jgi:glycosyltransferase involved in cell wall biosynthesis
MVVSIVIPSLSGGGAEKVTLLLIRALIREQKISRVYVGIPCEESRSLDCEVVTLGGYRAGVALGSFLKTALNDPAEKYLLTLGFINFAPFLRLLHPRAHLVLRIGNTPGPEMSALSLSARLRYTSSTRLALKACNEVIAQCSYMAEDVKKHFSVPDKKIRMIYNPIEPDLASWPGEAKSSVDGPYVFVAATFKPQKDLSTLLEGFARCRNLRGRRLVIAGVSPDNTAFSDLIANHGLNEQQVLRLGFRRDTYDLITNAEICVLTSLYEGFSNFLLEAAALGKYIVATNCPGGNAELFNHYSNVSTFAVGDTVRLAELLDSPQSDLSRREAHDSLVPFQFDTFITQYKYSLQIL